MAEWSKALDLNPTDSRYLIPSGAQVRTLPLSYIFAFLYTFLFTFFTSIRKHQPFIPVATPDLRQPF